MSCNGRYLHCLPLLVSAIAALSRLPLFHSFAPIAMASKRPSEEAPADDERPAKKAALDAAGSSTPSAALKVSFLTDVEGNWEYFVSFIRRSEVLSFPNGEELDASYAADIELADGWHFVFGGDVCDKGNAIGGSVRVARTLVRLKKRYADRVTLLIGNRDANKMNVTSELDPTYLANFPLEDVPGPYWVPADKRISPSAFLRKRLQLEEATPAADGDAEAAAAAAVAALHANNTAANRMRWLLHDTMGAPGEFERRQAELQLLRGVDEVRARAIAHRQCYRCRRRPARAR